MRKLLPMILLLMFPQWGMGPGPGTPASAGAGFAPTYEWVAGYASNGCGTTGLTPCLTAGQVFYKAVDEIGGNVATTSNTSATTGFLFEPSQINGLPAIQLSGSVSGTHLAPGTTINSAQTMTFYAVFDPSSFTGAVLASGGANFTLAFGLDASGKPYMSSINGVTTASGTTAFSLNTWEAGIWTYNNSTSAWAYYTCSAGSTTANGSGTTALTGLTSITGELSGNHSSAGMQGMYAEWGVILGSASTTGICAHVYSVYGI
jgi:hypothetical protein